MVLHAMPFDRQTRSTFAASDRSSMQGLILFMSICTPPRTLRVLRQIEQSIIWTCSAQLNVKINGYFAITSRNSG